MQMESEKKEIDEEKRIHNRIRSHITTAGAALLPFVQSIPPLAIWGGLMTIPLITYLGLLLTSPQFFLEAVYRMFFGGFILETAVAVIGLIVLGYSFIFMRLHKREGFIKTGPYALTRHPQYLGVMLFITTLSSRSYWLLSHTLGLGWLSPTDTILVWIGTIIAYILLAKVEESYLTKELGATYTEYRTEVGFIIPYTHSTSNWMEVLVTIVFLAATFLVLATIPDILMLI